MSRIVLDSSAVLAMVLREPGGERVRAAILSPDDSVAMSAVNWCEVLGKLIQKSAIMTAERLSAILPGVEVVPFGQAEADLVANMRKARPDISLGDRACLSLAAVRGATAWTTDKIWAKRDTGVQLEMLR